MELAEPRARDASRTVTFAASHHAKTTFLGEPQASFVTDRSQVIQLCIVKRPTVGLHVDKIFVEQFP